MGDVLSALLVCTVTCPVCNINEEEPPPNQTPIQTTNNHNHGEPNII